MRHASPPHVPGANDRVMVACLYCGWVSDEMTVEEWHNLGLPWYCDDCGKHARYYVRYAPHEHNEAMRLVHGNRGVWKHAETAKRAGA